MSPKYPEVMEVVLIVVAVGLLVAWLAIRNTRVQGDHGCSLCDRTFASRKELEAHLLEHGRVARPTLPG